MGAETCQETAGFLFKHACTKSPLGECGDCGKWVCRGHTRAVDGASLCIGCARKRLRPDKPGGGIVPNSGPKGGGARPRNRNRNRSYDNDPYFYGVSNYEGYGSYRQGSWGHDYYQETRDAADFTEADGTAFAHEGDEGWEQEMGAS